MNEQRQNPGRRATDRRAAREASFLRHWATRLAVAYVLLLSLFTVLTFLGQQRTSELADRLHTATYASCHRLNIQRAETNHDEFEQWQFFRLIIHLTATSKSRARPQALAFARQLNGYAASINWTPLTMCRAAVDNPRGYVPPTPRPFWLNVNGTVPKAVARAFTVGAGE